MHEILLYGLLPGAHDVVMLVARVVVGAFFAISGYHKLFNATRRASVRQTMLDDGIPFPRFNAVWVPLNELVCGTFVALGLFTVTSAAALLVICVVACWRDGLKRIQTFRPLDWFDWLDDVLYLPETLYAVLAVFFVIAGAGAYSLDAVIW